MERTRAVSSETRRTKQDTTATMAEMKVVPVRLPDELLARIDEHVARLRQWTGIEPSRSEVIKMAIDRGLQTVEATIKTYQDGSLHRHEDDDGEMRETNRYHGGTISWGKSTHHVDHVFGECKACGGLGRWTEPSRPTR